jgi:hypothetical protein
MAAQKAGIRKAILAILRPDKGERPHAATAVPAMIELSPGQVSGGPRRSRLQASAVWRPAAGLALALIVAAGGLFGLRWFGLQREAAQFRAAQNNMERLDTYLQTCRQCEFKDDAKKALAQLYAAEIKSAGFDRAKLEKSLTICGLSCPDELRQEALRQLDALNAERTQYDAAQHDIGLLQSYVRECRACEFKDDANRLLSEFASKRPVAPQTQIARPDDETDVIPPVASAPKSVPESVPKSDPERAIAAGDYTIQGYEAFVRDFPSYLNSPAFRAVIERMQEQALWKEAEQTPSEDEKRKLCSRMLILYPHGEYADQARECLATPSVVPQQQDSDLCYVTTLIPFGKRLILRTGPSFRAQPLKTHLVAGLKLAVTERSGDWMHVRLQNGETGWALSKFLEACREPSISDTHN